MTIWRNKRRAPLPARVKKVIDAVEGGQRLCKSYRFKKSGESEVEFHYEPSGKRVGPKSAEQAISTNEILPVGDGLFGAETSQQWKAKA